MSCDLTLQKRKDQPFDYDAFKTEANGMIPLAGQEPIFGDEMVGDKSLTIMYEVKYNPQVFKGFLKYAKAKGRKLNFLDRLLKRVDKDLAVEFYEQYQGEVLYEDVLTVFTHPGNEEEFSEVFKQLKNLAEKYDLVLDDPQLGGLLDLEAEEPRLLETPNG